jgi:hypothetical protein
MDERAIAIAGLPFSGRNIVHYRKMVLENQCLFGNCYGLKRIFLQKIQKKNFHLPVGLCWIDSAITKIVQRNLNDIFDGKKDRIVYEETSGYTFKSLSFLSINDIKLYYSRIARYETGKLQEHYLEQLKFADWPRDLATINGKIIDDIKSGQTKPRWIFKRKILERLKRKL